MAKNIDPNNPYAHRSPNPYDRHASKYGGGDGLELDARLNSQASQDPIDAHAPGYSNDTRETWLRGKGKPHPHFDSCKQYK
jgi:hypothetical protein